MKITHPKTMKVSVQMKMKNMMKKIFNKILQRNAKEDIPSKQLANY